MITNESSWVVRGPKFMVPRHSSLTRSAVRPSRRYSMWSLFLIGSASGRGREVWRLVTVIGRVQRATRRHDLVDTVERGRVERHIGRAEQVVELGHRLRPDDRRGHGAVLD